MENEEYTRINKVINDCGVTFEEVSSSVELLADAMLRDMVAEMIKYGYCIIGKDRMYLDDAGERFLENYEEELSNKMEVLSGEEK